MGQAKGKEMTVIEVFEALEDEERRNTRNYYRHTVPLQKNLQGMKNRLQRTHTNEGDESPGFDFLDCIENPRLLRALKSLKKIEMNVIELRYREALSFAQIAESLEMKDNTASKVHQRSLRKLRHILKEDTGV